MFRVTLFGNIECEWDYLEYRSIDGGGRFLLDVGFGPEVREMRKLERDFRWGSKAYVDARRTLSIPDTVHPLLFSQLILTFRHKWLNSRVSYPFFQSTVIQKHSSISPRSSLP
jgi:hypothetical protein